MPKIVDHEERRRRLALAVWQVVRERGVEGASLRNVARQAGWSHSSVQHYFSSQGELLDFAMRVIFDATERRLDAHEPPDDPREAARALLELLLPLDAQARTANEVWVAFLSRALVDAGARKLNAEGDRYLADLFRATLRDLADAGHLAPGTDVDLEADRLHALFDGLCLHAVTAPDRMPPARVRELYEHHLNTLIRP
ncbi:TetR family transcriptional regulator C-terminal domain-containing protein [Actinomadura sp. NPDC047616]|uniref:TetR/AcrR family transcriptional regulator n=1 Tax=Actinomadura sp. NPDC047616 TaxID=3155914 RepID=UPI0034008415